LKTRFSKSARLLARSVEVIVENNAGHDIRIEGFYNEVVITEEISEGVYEEIS